MKQISKTTFGKSFSAIKLAKILNTDVISINDRNKILSLINDIRNNFNQISKLKYKISLSDILLNHYKNDINSKIYPEIIKTLLLNILIATRRKTIK